MEQYLYVHMRFKGATGCRSSSARLKRFLIRGCSNGKDREKKNATRNIIFGVILKAYQIVVPFLMRTAMIYFMGVQYLGLNSLFTSILQVLNLAELGAGSAMIYSMYQPIASDDKKKICALMRLYKFYYRAIGCVIFQPFMEVWVGNELMLSFGMVVLFCIYFIDYECMALLSVYKDACGIWHQDRFRPLCEAGINLLLNLLLVNIGGLYGILLSTIISMSFVSLPWLVMNLFNFVFRRSSSEYISILIQNVIVVIVDMIVCYAICQMVHLGGIMTIIFRGAVCVVFSNISYFAIWKNNEDFKDAIKLLNSIFKGKLTFLLKK